MTDRPPRFLLDTSAILALRSNEAGASEVEAILRGASTTEPVLLSFVTRMEVSYRVEAEEGREAAEGTLRLLDAMPIAWVSCEPAILDRAARIKAGGKLSFADAWIAATALDRSATLVHRDPEFRAVKGLEQVVLPPK